MEMRTLAPEDSYIDFSSIFRRLIAGKNLIIGLGIIAGIVGLILAFVYIWARPVETTARVTFSFSGFEKGLYPDKSKFEPDDLRAADLIANTLKSMGMPENAALQAEIRTTLSVTGIIPVGIAKERDRLRAAGQMPGTFIPDEYELRLSAPRGFHLTSKERERFLTELAAAYRKRFERLYAEVPAEYGRVFENLKSNDYFEYEFILKHEVGNLERFLEQAGEDAKTFRSPQTGLSFSDLLNQVQLFDQLRVNYALSIIYSSGLTTDRQMALTKLAYQLTLLGSEEQRLKQEQEVVNELLERAQQRGQSYVLGAKTQMDPVRPMVDPGLLDTLVANDAYNFLVKKALSAGFDYERTHAQRAEVEERIKHIQSLPQSANSTIAAVTEAFNKAMRNMESEYVRLIDLIKLTQQDYSRQEFADAVRISAQPQTSKGIAMIALSGAICFALGIGLGAGLSLIGYTTLKAK